MPRQASYEFTSFKAMLESPRAPRPNKEAGVPSSTTSKPWVPVTRAQSFNKAQGLPAQEKEALILSAKVAADTERATLSTGLDDAEAAVAKLESKLSAFKNDFEQHIIGQQAASVLINRRLVELGLA